MLLLLLPAITLVRCPEFCSAHLLQYLEGILACLQLGMAGRRGNSLSHDVVVDTDCSQSAYGNAVNAWYFICFQGVKRAAKIYCEPGVQESLKKEISVNLMQLLQFQAGTM